jgi:hypothetical protein
MEVGGLEIIMGPNDAAEAVGHAWQLVGALPRCTMYCHYKSNLVTKCSKRLLQSPVLHHSSVKLPCRARGNILDPRLDTLARHV